MYGYRRSSENGLMINLNSISSSLSSIDSIGRRDNKSSIDKLVSQRDQMTASTSAWWRNHPKGEQRYSTTASVRNLGERSSDHYQNTDINHYAQRDQPKTCCISSRAALTSILSILLLLTIFRQTYDFLGQLWLQILINFFSILIIIVALFGLKQNRISYLVIFIVWASFNTLWNLLVISIHVKVRDIHISEDILSLYTGGINWWLTNGPGCSPYTISSQIHQSVSILKPNIITGCRFDYHLVESTQAAIHSCLSLISLLLCCYVAFIIRKNPFHFTAKRVDKPYRMNELTNGRSKVNHDPYPVNSISRFVSDPNTLRRAGNKVSSRSSQHSMASARSERRRQRHLTETGAVRTPRGSTSSMQRSQKYGSLSSRRSNSNRRDRRADISSLTYATTTNSSRFNGQRTRQSSVSSTDYLPSYQPPHSSSANLLSSYGEISSIDSRTINSSSRQQRGQHRLKGKGNINPVYDGSRTSVCSQNINPSNNYDDISNVYSVNNNGSVYGVSNSITDRPR